jgi:hypothetical protein
MSSINKPFKYEILEVIIVCIAFMAGCSTTPRREGSSTTLRAEDGTADLWQERFEVGDLVRSGILLDFDGTRYMELILEYEHRAILVVVFLDWPTLISIKLGGLSDQPGRGSRIVPSGSESTALAGALSRSMSKLGDNEANNVLILIEALSGRPIPQGRTWKFSRSGSSLDRGSKLPKE